MASNFFRHAQVLEKEFKNRLKQTYMLDVENSSIRQRFNILGGLVKEYTTTDWMKTNKVLKKIIRKKYIIFLWNF